MIFHENRLLADDSHVISYLIFFRKLGKMSRILSSAAVVIGALRVKVMITEQKQILYLQVRLLYIISKIVYMKHII